MARPLHLWQGSKAAVLLVIEHLNSEYDRRPKGRQMMSAGQVRAALSLSSLFRGAEKQRRTLLKECVDSWLAADCDFETWQASDPCGLCTRIQEHVQSARYLVTPANEGRANIAAQWRAIKSLRQIPEFLAAEDFLQLITSPFYRDVRPCRRPNCGRYFLRTPRRTAYCSAGCATHNTAVISTRKHRGRELDAKLRRARKALMDIAFDQPDAKDWKALAARKAGVTPKFLTRHIHNGKLRVPSILEARKGATQ